MNKTFRLLPLVALTAALAACGGSDGTNGTNGTNGSNGNNGATGPAGPQGPSASLFTPGNLLVSRAVYDPTFTVAGTLPNNSATIAAVTPGTYPNVFTNDANDANFGVTSEAYLDQWAPGATSGTQVMDVTKQAALQRWSFSTSFASKSEFALNVSLDQRSVAFVGYNTNVDQLDISNSNTPGAIDSTNTDTATPTYRTIGQLNFADNSLQFTNTNAYSGNNGRAAVLANGLYYIVGNAGNSGKSPSTAILDMLTSITGVQAIAPNSSCPFTQVIGQLISVSGAATYTPAACGLGTVTGGAAKGDDFGFALQQVAGQSADKTGKDVNLRGLYVGPDGTLYVSKGSGGNGVNTVYQVGATGALANGGTIPANAAITIVPGFPTTPATNLTNLTTPAQVTGTVYPFAMWIPASQPNLMFVADEGDGVAGDQVTGSGGLWVYQKQSNGTWKPLTNITTGLSLGTAYTVTDTAGLYGTKGASYTTTPDGLRQLAGQVNADGSFTIYATTSTIGNSIANFDAGADANQLVQINVSVSGSTVTTKGFNVMQTAAFGQALRGVAIVPNY